MIIVQPPTLILNVRPVFSGLAKFNDPRTQTADNIGTDYTRFITLTSQKSHKVRVRNHSGHSAVITCAPRAISDSIKKLRTAR